MKTVLITGCSTGFGRATALHFLDHGWNVIATMRNPAASDLPRSDRLTVLPLDVTDPDSIAAAVLAAGPIDVLVNNAGIGWLASVEGTTMETARSVFETNLFGAVALTREVLPGMRARGSGVIVNVSSSVTYGPLPLLSIYSASKAALNAFTESMAIELAPFGISTRLVLPGLAPATAFASNIMANDMASAHALEAYAPFTAQVMEGFQELGQGPVTTADGVAEAVLRAATDPNCPMRLAAGADSVALAEAA